MPIEPLGDRIIIQTIDEQESKTPGGILLPGNSQEKPSAAIAVAVCPGRLLQNGDVKPLTVQAGDKIVFSKYGVVDIKVEGEEEKYITENDVLGIVRENH